MEVRDLSEFFKGWFIGNFEPSMLKTLEFEVAIKSFLAGESEPHHKQIIATEFTVVLSGEIEINETKFYQNQIVRINPGESANFLALSDTTVLCIKTPSIATDKVLT
jgi:hypothetical protein